jgi:alpha-1,2-mannosyltransferase
MSMVRSVERFASGRFASGTWLTPQLMTFAAGAMVAGTAIALGVLFFTATGTLDRFGRPLGTDFSSFWTAGRMALEGHAAQAYDWAQHLAMQQRTHGTDMFFPWSYPPVFLAVAAAVAALPYVPALLAWQAASLLAALAAFRAILPDRRALLFGFGFPAVLICLGHGQTGFLTAALLTGGILALPRHEILAGILFGLLAYKPQFGLLLPFVLAAGGYWRAIAAAAATVLASVGVTLALWGWPVWQAFLDWLPLTQRIVFEAGDTGFEKFQSIFAWVRLWGGPLTLAYGLQGLVTLGALAGCLWTWRSGADHRLKGAALLTGVLLSSPYVLDYDLVAFGMALALLAAHGLERGFHPWEKTALALAWLVPVCAREVAQLTYLPLGFLMLAAVFVLIVLRVRAETAETARRLNLSGMVA